MATIRDIAKAAGVSQGTASNALNGKGNVSSAKLKLVHDAAAAMGYTINEKAQLLRRGSSRTISVILPNTAHHQYQAFYVSFQSYCKRANYQVRLYITNDCAETELEAMLDTKASMAVGAVVISSIPNADKAYAAEGLADVDVLFVERQPAQNSSYIGFDYVKCGVELAQKALDNGGKQILLISGNENYSNENSFCAGAFSVLNAAQNAKKVNVRHLHTNLYRRGKDGIDLFENDCPDTILLSSYSFAETIKDIQNCFYPEMKAKIYTVSPVFTLPESDFVKYELDYHLLGKQAAEKLMEQLESKTHTQTIVENFGYRQWAPPAIIKKRAKITVLSMDSPSTKALRHLSHLFTASSGVEVNIVSFSYDELFEVLSGMGDSSIYDVIRLHSGWLTKIAENTLMPLADIDPNIKSVFGDFMPGLLEEYSEVNGKIYALPSTPSVQFLFYRKDLFENNVYKRMFYEEHKHELCVPTTFEEYNRIAAFFTRSHNAFSPVEYGSVLALESTSMAAVEFLTRYFSLSDKLKAPNGSFLLDSPEAVQALRLLVELTPFTNGSSNLTWNDTADQFAQGRSAMAILFNNYTSRLLDGDSIVNGKIGYAVVPGGKPMFSGGVFGISQKCQAPQEALSYIRWACSETAATAMTMLGSVSPCKKTYENYEVINTYPWMEITQKCFENAHIDRIPARIAPEYDEKTFMSVLGMAVKSAYRNATDAKEALAFAQNVWMKHMRGE